MGAGSLARCLLFGGAAIGALSVGLAATEAQAQAELQRFNIPAQPLSSSILMFGNQAHVSVAAPAELIAGRTAAPVSGRLTARQALRGV